MGFWSSCFGFSRRTADIDMIKACEDEDPIARAVLAWQIAGGEEPAAVAESSSSSRPAAAPAPPASTSASAAAVEAETATADAAASGASTPPRHQAPRRGRRRRGPRRRLQARQGPRAGPPAAEGGATLASPASRKAALPRAVSGGCELTRGDSKVALALAVGAVAKGIGSGVADE